MTDQQRARDIGIPFGGRPGSLNAITDVAGLEVGHVTLIEGEGLRVVGTGPIRTGVTAILPRGRTHDPCFAGWYALNGNGEMTGTTWIEESGFLETPIVLTNTHSVGVVRDAVIAWMVEHNQVGEAASDLFGLPVVAETYDGDLNDINGFHVRQKHVFEALDAAAPGCVAEGSVGGGTGMITHDFKAGIGTASRVVESAGQAVTIGVLVQSNYGAFEDLVIAGIPMADAIPGPSGYRRGGDGSIIVVIATDAPLLPHQLKRLARRAPMGIARTGGVGADSSGDIFLALSTANPGVWSAAAPQADFLPNADMTNLFRGVIEATEEAILNALVAAESMTGCDGRRVDALPKPAVRDALSRHGRLT
ncbi:MAG: P1 family peptidase [Pseudomonadota bacterium]